MFSSIKSDDIAKRIPFAKLAEQYHLIRYEPRGRGQSPADNNAEHHTWPALAKDMLALADHLGIQNFIAGGTSMGAATAVWAALQAPERITELWLDTPADGWQQRPKVAAYFQKMAEQIKQHGVETLIRRRFQKQHPQEQAEQQAEDEMLRSMSLETLIAVLEGASHTDYPDIEQLKLLCLPTTILGRDDLPGHSLQTAESLQQALDGDLRVATSPPAIWSFL